MSIETASSTGTGQQRLAVRAVLSRVVAVVTGKGGIMKTSTIPAMAAECARRGMKVLIFEMDSSGACSRYEMGLEDTEHDDHGKSLADALTSTMMGIPQAPKVVQAVRTYPGGGQIDIVVGGSELDLAIEAMATVAHVRKVKYVHCLAEVIALIAPGYGIVLVDNDPKNKPVRLMVLSAAAASYAPIDYDPAAYGDGLAILRDEIAEARQYNPEHFFIGAVCVRIPEPTVRAWRKKQKGGDNTGGELAAIMSDVQGILADPTFDVERALLPQYPMAFDSIIRDAKLAAAKARGAHLTIIDYLAQQGADLDDEALLKKYPVIGDYRSLAAEMVTAILTIAEARASA